MSDTVTFKKSDIWDEWTKINKITMEMDNDDSLLEYLRGRLATLEYIHKGVLYGEPSKEWLDVGKALKGGK